MRFAFLHRQESVDVGTAQEIEERAFNAVCEIVSENKFIDIMFFCIFFEFSISPIPEVSFGVFLWFCFFGYDERGSVKKLLYKLFILFVSCSDSMITMYKK